MPVSHLLSNGWTAKRNKDRYYFSTFHSSSLPLSGSLGCAHESMCSTFTSCAEEATGTIKRLGEQTRFFSSKIAFKILYLEWETYNVEQLRKKEIKSSSLQAFLPPGTAAKTTKQSQR